MGFKQFKEEVRRIIASLSQVPKSKRRKKLSDEIGKLPPEIRETAVELISVAVEVNDETPSLYQNRDKIGLFGSLIVFILLLIFIGIQIPNPTDFQIFIFRFVLALVAAFFGGTLPGFLKIQGHFQMLTIRAGGACAFFVLVYCVNPPKLVHNVPDNAGQNQVTNTVSQH